MTVSVRPRAPSGLRASLITAIAAIVVSPVVPVRADPGPGSAPAAPIAVDHSDLAVGEWSPIQPLGRIGWHSSVYDPVGHRVILFGGVKGGASWPAYGMTNETWELKLDGRSTWRRIPTLGPHPADRADHAAIYDPVRNRMIVFGGVRGQFWTQYLNDTWALSLDGTPTWTPLAPEGGFAPPPMAAHEVVYDPQTDRMILGGGWDDYRGRSYAHEIWALALGGVPRWTRLNPSIGPPPHSSPNPGIVLDARRRRLVSVRWHGSGEMEVWVSGLSGIMAWTRTGATGPGPEGSSVREVAYDSLGDRVLVFGGDSRDLSRVWVLTPVGPGSFAWSFLDVPGGPTGLRRGHTLEWDPVDGRLIIVDGEGSLDPGAPRVGNATVAIRMAGTPTPEILVPDDPDAGVAPLKRALHGSFYDPVDRRLVVVGGVYRETATCCMHYQCSYDIHPNDVWELRFGTPPKWGRVGTTGTGPPGRAEWSVAYDPLRHRAIAYGGYTASYGNCVHGGPEHLVSYDDRVHVLTLGKSPGWSVLQTRGPTPAGRRRHASVYDPVRDRMLVFGGSVDGLWALAPDGEWSRLEAGGEAPDGGQGVSLVYDPFRDRIVAIGGGAGGLTRAWALSLEPTLEWNEVAAAGIPPEARARPGAVYDPVRDRIVVDGGELPGGSAAVGTWALTLGDSPAWRQLGPPSGPGARFGHSPVYEPEQDRMVFFGGALDPRTAYSETWELVWGDSSTSVGVDIKPGNPDNPVQPESGGETAVALLGSDRLRVGAIDLGSLRIAWAPPVRGPDRQPRSHVADVNRDGFDDLVVHVETRRLAMGAERRQIPIEGRTVTGGHFRGFDRVRIVPGSSAAEPQSRDRQNGDKVSRLAFDLSIGVSASGAELPVRLSLPGRGPATLQITDLSGRRLVEEHVTGRSPGEIHLILRPRSPLPAGIYFARLGHQGQAIHRKFLVLH